MTFEWNLNSLPTYFLIQCNEINFHSWTFSLHNLIPEYFKLTILWTKLTFFIPPSLYLLYNVLCLIFDFLFPHKYIFCTCFSSPITKFGIVVNIANSTIFVMAEDLKVVIFPTKVSFLIRYSLITLTMFLMESKKFKSSWSFLL